MHNRDLFTFAFSVSALALTAASGCSTSHDNGNSAACDSYFNVVFAGKCNGPLIAPSDVDRVRQRFNTECTSTLSLPGVAISASQLNACQSAIEASGCSQLNEESGPCAFQRGTLAAGTECINDSQCQSGACLTDNSGADGGNPSCGACGPVAGEGQPCSSGTCGPNLACVTTNSSSTCVAIAYGDSGATCDGATNQCKPGLVCDFMTGQCATAGGMGSPCSSEEACLAPLVCPVSGMPSTCQNPGQTGASCSEDVDCVSGLGCDSTSSMCGSVTWVAAGQPCGGNTRCTVGYCPENETQSGGGTCPTVIADGQACQEGDTASTCDSLAQCQDGKCVLGYDNLCR